MQLKRMLKVWHIAELYPPDYGGGAAVYVRDVCRFLADRGHDVRVWCTESRSASDYAVREDSDGPVKLYRINLPYFRTQDPGGSRLGIRGWKRHRGLVTRLAEEFLSDWQPDLVHFHSPFSLVEECSGLIADRRIPIIGMAHCAWLLCPRLNLIRSPRTEPCRGPGAARCLECVYSHWDGSRLRATIKLPWRLLKLGLYPAYRLWQRARLRRQTDGLVAYSEFMADVHRPHLRSPVEHVPLGIDLSALPLERRALPLRPLRFGFVGGFQPHKGVWHVLDAAAGLKERLPDFEIHIWGPTTPEAQNEIESRGLKGRVILHGLFQTEQKWEVFASFHVLIMATTVREAYGRVIQEAAAVGAPTIGPAEGGIAEQIRDGIDGLLYPFRDAAGLERQMARVLENPTLVGQLAANLRPVVDTREAVGAIERFYHQVIDQKRRIPLALSGPEA
jgi:glycosyltransferase involved in cell wall biosynthesis